MEGRKNGVGWQMRQRDNLQETRDKKLPQNLVEWTRDWATKCKLGCKFPEAKRGKQSCKYIHTPRRASVPNST